jgi:hypothetical protein
MYGQDWQIPAGHRIGVLISGANAEWWIHVPTNTDVAVTSAAIGLPFLRIDRSPSLPGAPTPRLEEWLRHHFAPVTKATITGNTRPFVLPSKLS